MAKPLEPPEIMFAFGMLSAMNGAMTYNDSKFTELSSLIGHLIVMVCSVSIASVIKDSKKLKKGDPGYSTMVVGIHLGLVLLLVFFVLNAVRYFFIRGVEEKAYLNIYVLANIFFSGLFFVLMLMEKPKKETAGATTDTTGTTSGRKTSRKLFDVNKPAPAAAGTSTPASTDDPTKPEEEKKDD